MNSANRSRFISAARASMCPPVRFRLRGLLALALIALGSGTLHAGSGICRVTIDGDAGNDGGSWAQAKSLHGALADPACTDIWLAAGVYTPDDADPAVSFVLRGGTSVYGGFAGDEDSLDQRDPATQRSVLSGDIGADDQVDAHGVTLDAGDVLGLNSHTVVHVDAASNGVVRLDGLTVTAGRIEAPPESTAGLDAACRSAAHDEACTQAWREHLRGGAPQIAAAGVSCVASGSDQACDLALRQVLLRGNAAVTGAALTCAALDDARCNADLLDVSVIGNVATQMGGGILQVGLNASQSALSVRNATFVDNHAGIGGAVMTFAIASSVGNALTLDQVSFKGNTAQGAGGALGVLTDDPQSVIELEGVIAWDNGEAPIGAAVPFTIRRSIVEHGCPEGAGCMLLISSDPQLAAVDDTHFLPYLLPAASSPAVDAMPCADAPAADQRGVERPQGAACDIGAVEVRQAALDVAVQGPGSVTAVIVPPPLAAGIVQCRQDSGDCQAWYGADHAATPVRLLLQADVGNVLVSAQGCDGALEGQSYLTAALLEDCTVTVSYGEPAYSVGGTVTGLLGSGLAITLNGSATLPIDDNGSFVFNTALPGGAQYTVGVASQPTQPVQSCAVFNGSGQIGDADVGNVVVHCGAANTYTVGGTLSGLAGGASVAVSLNGGPPLTLAANGAYVFPQLFVPGDGYSVAVVEQPQGQHCILSHESGVVGSAAVDDLDIGCSAGGADLHLTLDDAGDYAAYGRVRSYQVVLANTGNGTASDVAIAATFDAALDAANAQWTCLVGAPGASCGGSGSGGLADIVTLPPGAAAVWIVDVAVHADSNAAQATLLVEAEGAAAASDTNTLVIFRDGLDVPYGESADAPAR